MAEGFDPERFVQKDLADLFICSICLCVVRDPVACKSEHLFCKKCLTSALCAQVKNDLDTTCPECRCRINLEVLPEPSRLVKGVYSTLKIRCKYFERGCEEEVPVLRIRKHERTCKMKKQADAGRGGGQQRSTRSADANLSQDSKWTLTRQERIRRTEHSQQAEEERLTFEGLLLINHSLAYALQTLGASVDYFSKESAIFRKWEVRSSCLLVLAFLFSMLATIDPEMLCQPFLVAFVTCQIISCWEHRGVFINLLYYKLIFEPIYYKSVGVQRFFLKYAWDSASFAVIIAFSFTKGASNIWMAVMTPPWGSNFQLLSRAAVCIILAPVGWSAMRTLICVIGWSYSDRPYSHPRIKKETIRPCAMDVILAVLLVSTLVIDIVQPLATDLPGHELEVVLICSLNLFTIFTALNHQQRVTSFLAFSEDDDVIITSLYNNSSLQGHRQK